MPESTSPRSHRRYAGTAAAVALAAVAIGGLNSAAADTPRTHVVTMQAMRFEPENLTVRQGERVVWVNEDLVPHTVVHDTFDSQLIAPGASWRYVARQPGEYSYRCTLHPTMKAALIVQ